MIVQPAPIGPRSAPRRAIRLVALVVPVALLVAVVAFGVAGPPPAPRPVAAASPAPTGDARTPGPSSPAPATAVLARFPGEVAGLPVHGVRWTVTARNRGLARGVVAVGGYLGAGALPRGCPDDATFAPLSSPCARLGILGETPWTGPETAADHPGFHLHPQFPPGVAIPAAAMAVADGATAVPVILLGRFDDPRAAPCVPAGRHCGQEFVVERVTWAAGATFGTAPSLDARIPAAMDRAGLVSGAASALASLAPDGYPLLAALVLPATIEGMEPTAVGAVSGLDPSSPVWFVRGLVRTGDPAAVEWRIVGAGGAGVIAAGEVQASRLFGTGGARPGG